MGPLLAGEVSLLRQLKASVTCAETSVVRVFAPARFAD
jgi:hypothetical protein